MEVVHPTLSYLHELFKEKRYSDLVGLVENEFFDAKCQPYHFDSGEHVKREFAKDVAAFANAGGGFIVIGLSTKPLETHPGECVDSVRAIPRHTIEPNRYYDLISEWVYPEPRINCTWHPVSGDSKGVLAIEIPEQDPLLKPFLITKIVDGTKVRETQMGHVERRRDRTAIATVAELHQAIRIGRMLGQPLLDRIENLEALLYEHFKQSAEATGSQLRREQAIERIDRVLKEEGLASKRCIVLGAMPGEHAQSRTLFAPDGGNVRRDLEHPEALRPDGWDINTHSTARIMKGECVRLSDGVQKALYFYRDGCLIFVAGDYLHSPWRNENSINALALVEVVANFSRFYVRRILPDLTVLPKLLDCVIGVRGAQSNGKGWSLVPGEWRPGRLIVSEYRDAPQNKWHKVIGAASDADPDEIAFSLLRELYLWFGYTEDRIPYFAIDGGRKVIQINATSP